MKNITAIFLTAFIVSGIVATLILFLFNLPTREAIFAGAFSGFFTGIVITIMACKNQRALKV